MSSHKVPLTFTFHQGGLRPPLFVAGTFSDPPWQPEEMEASTDEHGEFTFTKKIMVNESSEIQYKYLSASGDWWLTDPNADTVTDEQGNVNSIIRAPTRNIAPETKPEQEVLSSKAQDKAAGDNSHEAEASETAHEHRDTPTINLDSSYGKALREKKRRLSLPPMEEAASTAAEVADSASQLDQNEFGGTDHLGVDDGSEVLPLFSHECFAPISERPPSGERLEPEQDSPGNSSERLDQSSIDYDDPRLERFPSDRNAIIATVRRLSTIVQVDPTVVDTVPLSPVIKSRLPDVGSPSGKPYSSAEDTITSHEQPEGLLSRPTAGPGASRSSLHSIAEGDEVANGSTTLPRVEDPITAARHIGPVQDRKVSSASSSNDDEGIALSTSPPTIHRTKKTMDDEPARDEADKDQLRLISENTSFASSSSAFEELGRPRKPQKPTISERPPSSSSVTPLRDSKQNGNWIKLFLRTLFIDWIGGVARWIRSRGRRSV